MKRKTTNKPKVFSNTHPTNTYIPVKPIKPNYVSSIEGYVRKGQVLHAVKIMSDTNEMSLMQSKDIIEIYRETGNWDHFQFAIYPKDLAKRIANILNDKNLLSDMIPISSLIYLIDKILRENG